MVLPQFIAGFHALFDIIGLPGNLLVIVTIVLERRFHVMRYILLASLAVSDFLSLILVNSFRISSTAQERWLHGENTCHLNLSFAKYFYLNTVFHLIAVSNERYNAIVKSPLTYDGTITKSRMVFIALIWMIPLPLCISPILGWGKYVYNPEVFACEGRMEGWLTRSGLTGLDMAIVIAFFLVPFLVLAFLNWSVYKTAKRQICAIEVQVGSFPALEIHQPEMSRKIKERKAAVDVSIIIAAFLLSFLPTWIVGFCRRFVKTIKVPPELVLITSCIFFVGTLCNPIIYSIRKTEFRRGVKNVLMRIGLCRCSNEIEEIATNDFILSCVRGIGQDMIATNNFISRANNIDNDVIATNHVNLDTETTFPSSATALARQNMERRCHWSMGMTRLYFSSRLSPIPEVVNEDE